MKNTSLGIVYLIALGAFALGMDSYMTAGLIPMIESSFSVSVVRAAQLVTAFTLAYGLTSPIFVALLPAKQNRLGLLIALAIFSIANVASALSTSYTMLVITRIFAGAGAGVYLAMGIMASATLTSIEHRGKSIAIIMAGMASGTVLGVPISLFIAESFGWQSAMWLVSFLGFISFFGLSIKLPALPSAKKANLIDKLLILSDFRVILILGVSFLAAVASLGMYTYIAPFMSAAEFGGIQRITPFLWIWGLGGVVGSFFIGYFADRIDNHVLITGIMTILTLSLFSLPIFTSINTWLAFFPLAIWGAVGWALQVPQNNRLISVREKKGGGNLAVALNESALYLGSAVGASAGGLVYIFELGVWTLPILAGSVALLGLILQIIASRIFQSQ